MKCIRWDHGELASRMHRNFMEGRPLLEGYEHYEFYADMENVDKGMKCHIDYFKLLDKQYQDSRFILNSGDKKEWIQRRLCHSSYLTRSMQVLHTTSKKHVIESWGREWDDHMVNVHQYFSKKNGNEHKLLVFDPRKHHIMSLFLFVNPIHYVYQHFEEKYTRQWVHRLGGPIALHHRPVTPTVLSRVQVYCVALDVRRQYIEKVLCRFPHVLYVSSITPNDLTLQDYRRLSTTCMTGPPITYCHLCNYRREHLPIYGKLTKLCVHLSYLVALRHALEKCTRQYVLIFEDDIYFQVTDQDFDHHIADFCASPYDIAYLGFCSCRHGDDVIASYPDKNCRFIPLPHNQSIRCKHAIIYKLPYIRTILGELLPMMFNSDIVLNHANIQVKGKVAIARHPIVFQDRTLLGSHNENSLSSSDLPLY